VTVLQAQHRTKQTAFYISVVTQKSTKFDQSWIWATKDLGTSQLWCWRFKTAGTWRATGWVVHNCERLWYLHPWGSSSPRAMTSSALPLKVMAPLQCHIPQNLKSQHGVTEMIHVVQQQYTLQSLYKTRTRRIHSIIHPSSLMWFWPCIVV